MSPAFRLSYIYFASFLSIIRQVNTEHALPIFAGLWYGRANSPDYDACGTFMHAYIPAELSTSPLDSVKTLAPYYSDCTWDYANAVNDMNSTSMPYGFDYDSYNDWNKIILDPNAAVSIHYAISCIDSNGLPLHNKFLPWAYPKYDCPVNTRNSYDNVTYEVGCTTTPTPCMGDIVGRDLSSNGLEGAGHVGLVTSYNVSNPTVIEILDEPPRICYEPLYGNDSFSSADKYWGEKYGLGNNTRISLNVAADIIMAGYEQTFYSVMYTLGWAYYPGGTMDHPNDCLFRCDSFVYYCYESAGLKIQDSFTPYITYPVTLFDDFLCSADPIGTCSTQVERPHRKISETKNDLVPKNFSILNVTTSVLEIFKILRPALMEKSLQQKILPNIIAKYKNTDANISEIFVRCLCFELAKMSPAQVDSEIKFLLSDLLFKYKYLSRDNFLLILMKNTLRSYAEKPYSNWLSAFFALKSETQADKERNMIAYVDQQEVVEQAHLVSASRMSSLKSLSQEKTCAYGSFFQKAYHHPKLFTQEEKILLRLGLNEMRYPVDDVNVLNFSCSSSSVASRKFR